MAGVIGAFGAREPAVPNEAMLNKPPVKSPFATCMPPRTVSDNPPVTTPSMALGTEHIFVTSYKSLLNVSS